MMDLKISVLIPTYNRPEYLREALKSVLGQSLKSYEVIVADDNPNEEINKKNFEVVNEFAKDYPFIKYHKNEKNLGPAGNYKNLFYLASGNLIHFLGDDDILAPYTLEELSKPFKEDNDIVISAGKTLFVDEKLRVIYLPTLKSYLEFYEKYFNDSCVNGKWLIEKSLEKLFNIMGSFSGFMFRKDKVDFELFKFNNIEFEANSDWFLWMNLAKRGKVYLSSKVSNLLRIHGANDQLNIKTAIKGAVERQVFLTKEFIDSLGIDENLFRYKDGFAESLYYINVLYPYIKTDRKLSKDLKQLLNKIYNTNLDLKIERKPFSIIIVSYNSSDTIKECVQSVLDSYLLENDEIIIVDNNSKDNTVEIVESFGDSRIKIIKNSENLGYSKAINQGVELSKNSYLVFLNPDTVVISKDWLNRFYKELKDKHVAMVGPVSDIAMYKNSLSGYILPSLQFLDLGRYEKFLKYIYNDYREDTTLLSGFCIGISKERFLEFGKFDENLILGFDDFDFSLKAQEKNLKQYVLPSVLISHKNHKSFEKDIRKANYLNKLSLYNFLKKLIKRYGYGNVPNPIDLFMKDLKKTEPFYAFDLSDGRYRYVFKFTDKEKSKDFFRQKAKIIKSKPRIAIITVNYFSSEYIKNLAKSIIESDYPNIDFIVVDNSENEEEFNKLENILKEVFKETTTKQYYLLKNINNGYAGGNNLGIRYAIENLKSEYIWLLNPDTKIEKNTPLELLKTLEYTDVPVITCKIKNYDDENVQYVGDNVFLGGAENLKDYGLRYVKFLSGANIFMRSEVIEKVGYINEDFFLYFEDNEFLIRLRKNGINPIYTPFTFIRHKVGGTTDKSNKYPLWYYYEIRNRLLILDYAADNKYDFMDYLTITLDEIRKSYIESDHNKKQAILDGIFDFSKRIKEKVNRGNFDKEEIENRLKEHESYTEDVIIDYDIEKRYLKLKLNPEKIDLFDEFLELVKIKEIIF
jgi:GT2 family glycosyltransferase